MGYEWNDETAAHPAEDRIEFRRGSAEDLPIDDDSTDYVFAFDSFEHWRDKGRGLVEVRRVLRSGGRSVLVKDFDLPDAKDAALAVVDMLARFGFALLSKRFIEAEGVSFTLWVSATSG